MKSLLATLLLSAALTTPAQTATVRLAWNAPATGPAPTGYVLQRKIGQAGVYADLPLAIAGIATTVDDTTVPDGQIICYQLVSTVLPYRSAPSNEVCTAVLVAPLNLRIVP